MKRPRSSSQSRSTSAGVADGPAEALQRQRPERVDQRLAEHRPARVADPPRVPAEPAVVLDQDREAEPAVGPPSPDRFELGRGVEARLVGLDDPEQAVALEVAVGEQPVGLRADPRLLRRVADRETPGPGQQRRLDRLGLPRGAGGDVVEGAPHAGDRPVPEDRVADEAVGALGGEQALELGPRAGGLEAAVDDRREAGVPVPLPGVAPRARFGVGVGNALGGAFAPVLPEYALGLGQRALSVIHATAEATAPADPAGQDLANAPIAPHPGAGPVKIGAATGLARSC